MLSGLKFIPRDQIDKAQEEDLDDSKRERKKSSNRKGRDRKKKRSSQHQSSDEDDLQRITNVSRKKKKWYSSDESSSTSESGSDQDVKKYRNKEKKKGKSKYKKSGRGRKHNSSQGHSVSDKEYEDEGSYSSGEDTLQRASRKHERKKGNRGAEKEYVGNDLPDNNSTARKEIGLEWMLRPKDNMERNPATTSDQLEEPRAEEMKKENPRELNPYMRNDGTGYPEVAGGTKTGGNQHQSSAVVGDGGASWRMKALKRAQEQAVREGRKLDEVVEDRWGSMGQLAVSVASRRAAPSRAHLHAIKHRQKGLTEEQPTQGADKKEKNIGREAQRDVSRHHPEMKVPKLDDSLSWGKQKSQIPSSKDSGLISAAISSLNKFANDGSFMQEVCNRQNDGHGGSVGSQYTLGRKLESDLGSIEQEKRPSDSGELVNQGLSANQLAAKAMQLRLKGRHEEAEKLMKEAENMKQKQVAVNESSKPQKERNPGKYISHETSIRQRTKEDDTDMQLVRKIVQNKQFSISGQADDEYDFDDGPSRKTRKKGGNDHKLTEKTNFPKRIMTQQERCQFCFENPNRPSHLVVAIGNFTYLSLPHWQCIVPGHCCILTLQHESATRSVDNNVWDEIRNFKKCLIMMFAKQEKDLVFLETVMGLAQQRRHCLVECIPLPQDIAKQAPLYFKKAIDEAEDEWSQHNAKKLINTSEKGLRGSIPKDFPYFHVEFGLDKGFVHVIDDEKQFQSNFGLNVIRGMLRLPEEDMFSRRKRDSLETQKQAVSSFARDWEPFDWTKQLD
ncbi:uncharacterized protein LOC127806162 [Diospyros lotus]|uniref:uncharacterized protein LOC127806162 n=1 Tax=Diospyros lotus TaxID=55363 RepID=UPI00224CA5B8|nr:uncharacterized protein LOC127806162 [Diospyros lotus]